MKSTPRTRKVGEAVREALAEVLRARGLVRVQDVKSRVIPLL